MNQESVKENFAENNRDEEMKNIDAVTEEKEKETPNKKEKTFRPRNLSFIKIKEDLLTSPKSKIVIFCLLLITLLEILRELVNILYSARGIPRSLSLKENITTG